MAARMNIDTQCGFTGRTLYNLDILELTLFLAQTEALLRQPFLQEYTKSSTSGDTIS